MFALIIVVATAILTIVAPLAVCIIVDRFTR